MNKIDRRSKFGLLSVCVLAGAGFVIPSVRGDDRGGPPRQQPGGYDAPRGRDSGPREPESLSGTVLGFNLGPQGEPDGLLVKDSAGKISQVNFPPRLGGRMQQAVTTGDAVTLSAVPMRSHTDHSVYGLVSVTGAKGQKLEVGPPGDGQTAHAEGTIKYLNYDRGGQVNGAVLISGDFVEMGRSASRLNLQVGEKLTADGPARPTPDGQKCVHADTVNGQTLDRSQDQQPRGERPRQLADRSGPPPRDGRDDNGPDDRRRPSDQGARNGRPAGDENGNGSIDRAQDRPDGDPPPRNGGRGHGDRPPPPPQGSDDGASRDRGPSNRGPANGRSREGSNDDGPQDGPPPGGPRERGNRPPPPPQGDGGGRQNDGSQGGGRNGPPPDQQ